MNLVLKESDLTLTLKKTKLRLDQNISHYWLHCCVTWHAMHIHDPKKKKMTPIDYGYYGDLCSSPALNPNLQDCFTSRAVSREYIRCAHLTPDSSTPIDFWRPLWTYLSRCYQARLYPLLCYTMTMAVIWVFWPECVLNSTVRFRFWDVFWSDCQIGIVLAVLSRSVDKFSSRQLQYIPSFNHGGAPWLNFRATTAIPLLVLPHLEIIAVGWGTVESYYGGKRSLGLDLCLASAGTEISCWTGRENAASFFSYLFELLFHCPFVPFGKKM